MEHDLSSLGCHVELHSIIHTVIKNRLKQGLIPMERILVTIRKHRKKAEDISILSPEKKREIKEKAKEKQKQQESENQEAFLSVTKAGHSAKLKSTKETGTEAKSLIHEHVNNTMKKAHRCCVLRWEYDIACVWIFFLRFWDNVRNRGFSVLRIHY